MSPRAEPRKKLLDLLRLVIRYDDIIQLQTGLRRFRQGQHQHILPGFRESALRASRAMVGVPLKAAAGQATTAKLQTN